MLKANVEKYKKIVESLISPAVVVVDNANAMKPRWTAILPAIITLFRLFKATAALLEDNFLLVADRQAGNIYQVDLSTGDSNGLLATSSSAEPTALAFDPTARDIYWIDAASRTINKYSLPTGSTGTIYQFPSSNSIEYELNEFGLDVNVIQCSNLQLDVTRRKLYYAWNSSIAEISLDGSNVRLIDYNDGSLPRSLVLDSSTMTLYWISTREIHPGYYSGVYRFRSWIYRSSVTSPSRMVIVNYTYLCHPCALTVDFTASLMYWADECYHWIERSNLDGSGHTVLWSYSTSQYFVMALDSTYLYYARTNARYIMPIRLTTGTSTRLLNTTITFSRPCAMELVINSTRAGTSSSSTTTETRLPTITTTRPLTTAATTTTTTTRPTTTRTPISTTTTRTPQTTSTPTSSLVTPPTPSLWTTRHTSTASTTDSSSPSPLPSVVSPYIPRATSTCGFTVTPWAQRRSSTSPANPPPNEYLTILYAVIVVGVVVIIVAIIIVAGVVLYKRRNSPQQLHSRGAAQVSPSHLQSHQLQQQNIMEMATNHIYADVNYAPVGGHQTLRVQNGTSPAVYHVPSYQQATEPPPAYQPLDPKTQLQPEDVRVFSSNLRNTV